MHPHQLMISAPLTSFYFAMSHCEYPSQIILSLFPVKSFSERAWKSYSLRKSFDAVLSALDLFTAL